MNRSTSHLLNLLGGLEQVQVHVLAVLIVINHRIHGSSDASSWQAVDQAGGQIDGLRWLQLFVALIENALAGAILVLRKLVALTA